MHLEVGALAHLEVHLARLDEERLVLLHVVLARELLARGDVQDLADVAVVSAQMIS